MDNLQILWEYQQADRDVERCEKELKNTPTRKKLVKLQRFLQASQNKIAELEKMAVVKQNTLSDLETQNKALLEDLEDLNKDIGYYSECGDDELDQKEIEQLVKNTEKTYDAIVGLKKQVSKIKQEVEGSDKAVRELLQKMVAAKNEYDGLRVEYNKEMEGSSGALKELKEKLAAMEKQVPEILISEYKRIKGFRPNPVAILSENRCGGCNMQLPSGVAAAVMSSDKPVECENCGRILILK